MSDNSEKTVVVRKGMSFTTILGLIFVVLKLTENINWSWIWVLSPFWLPMSLWLLFSVSIFAVLVSKDK